MGNTHFNFLQNLKLLLPQAIKFQKIYSEVNASLAQAYLNNKNQDSARFFISKAGAFSKNNDKKARYLFIHGQLLEKINLLEKMFLLNLSVKLFFKKKT